ncbi:penicillin-binding transpeptidase domain-containing protein [Isoptericola sp. b441]|uniref:Beta-lactamase n=1 Tax=Actinotalea lenta TaxID=3064654 RepID=A0ABT9DAS4_9CELL|nr:penicillin-binding transpeptidase domain-containing protein [Isoptericola sp. b441]MDO8106288.1 penicillin-binding transpeptidase domain-containing protein [Isoptericola sp. b441]
MGRRTRTEAWRARLVEGGLVLLVGAALSACTPDRPGPEQAAEALAAAVASGDFSHVAFVEDQQAAATQRRADAYAALGPHEPRVTIHDVAVHADDDAATANLSFRWDLGTAEPWEYTTQADLTRGSPGDPDVWLVRWAPRILAPDLGPTEVLSTERLPAARADVLGAAGTVIVHPRPVQRIGIDKTRGDAATQEADARALATALGMDPDAFASRVEASGTKAFVQAIVVRDDDPDYDVEALTSSTTTRAVAGSLPLAPTRAFAREVLGTVGPATAEIVDDSDGAVVAGDLAGRSGLMRQYDSQLRGTSGLRVLATSEDSDVVRQLYRTEPVDGTPLQTTLDVGLQIAADSVLAGVGPASAVVAIRPSTGDVLAVASGPGSDGLSTATLGQYAPGSTFKVVSALALLRGGLRPDGPVDCPATVTVDGREFSNYPDYPAAHLGTIDLATAVAQSCNTAFIGQRAVAGAQALVDAAGSLGLTTDTDLGFPAFLGSVPADSTGTDHAASMIGQGRVLASPLGMATVAASVAAGHTVVPRLVLPAGGTESPASLASQPLTSAEATTVHALMRGVVTDGGATFLQDVPGPEVAAKTGTAQFGPAGQVANHTWMIAIQGDLAVAVFVEVGDYGSTTAGPLLEAFLRAVPRS